MFDAILPERYGIRDSFFWISGGFLDDPSEVIHGHLIRIPSFHISKTFATYPATCLSSPFPTVYEGNPESCISGRSEYVSWVCWRFLDI